MTSHLVLLVSFPSKPAGPFDLDVLWEDEQKWQCISQAIAIWHRLEQFTFIETD